MNIIAFYLPQYYAFPENDEWWGKGFTEWTNVKKAKPLYKGHYQPTLPLDNNFYCLEDKNVFKWQINLAKKYGITGFCFYHYWMGEGRQLMQKPVEMYLQNKDLDFPFCLSWANHNWSRTWEGGNNSILMDVRYGGKDEWDRHFQYLLPFFKDERYIQIDKKPVFLIYQPELIDSLHDMLSYFNEKAKENGLLGITVVSQYSAYITQNKLNEKLINYSICYEPTFTREEFNSQETSTRIKNAFFVSPKYFISRLKLRVRKTISALTKGKYEPVAREIIDYDGVWQTIIKRKVTNNNKSLIPGAFVNFDSSPRKGKFGVVTKGFTPRKFGYYFEKLLKKTTDEYKKDYIFITAWNEWGEGAYMEPDQKHGYEVLEALQTAIWNYEQSNK